MATKGRAVEGLEIFHVPPSWGEIGKAVTTWKNRGMKTGPLPVILLYAINLILLALIVYGLYYGLQGSAIRGF